MSDIRQLSSITRADQALVGDQFALLGELSGSKLQEIKIPAGLVLSKNFYETFVERNKLKQVIKTSLAETNLYKQSSIEATAQQLKKKILKASFSAEMKAEVNKSLRDLKGSRLSLVKNAVPDQSEMLTTSLEDALVINNSVDAVLSAIKQAIVDHFSVDHITYVLSKGYDFRSLPLSFLLQEMSTADMYAEARMHDVTMTVVTRRGSVRKGSLLETCTLFTPSLDRSVPPVIRRVQETTLKQRQESITDTEIATLGKLTQKIAAFYKNPVTIHAAYNRTKNQWQVLDIALVGKSTKKVLPVYTLQKTGTVITTGKAVGQSIGAGPVVHVSELDRSIEPGSVLFVRSADARYTKLFEQAAAVVAEGEGAESFTAQFCRERGIPCVLGIKKAKQLCKDGQLVTVSCAEGVGVIYKGVLPFKVEPYVAENTTSTPLRLTVTDASAAEHLSALPLQGVGLLPEETLYATHIGIHPQALVHYASLPKKVKDAVKEFAAGEKPVIKATRRLAEEIARVTASFHGREVVFRLSAADTADFVQLIGGNLFEKKERNPAMGWRGVARFIDPSYADAFSITTEALRMVREDWGLTNVSVLVPFCRTIEEGKTILSVLKKAGLEQGKNGLKIYVMCEIPSNALLAQDFIKLFDGFEIGLNSLTEFTLGADRSIFSEHAYHEEDKAVKQLVREVIKVAHRHGKTVGICDATPSEYPHFAAFLVQEGIDSITVLPDRWQKVQTAIHGAEKKLNAVPMALPFKVMSKTVSLAGFAAISLMLTGYTCQTVNVDELKKELAQKAAAQVEEYKQQLAAQVAQERAEEKARAVERYHERGFADFSLTYPAGWKITNKPAGVEIRSASSSAYFVVRREPRKAMKEYSFTTTTQWLNNDIGVYETADVKGIVIFPNDKAYTEVIVMEGDKGSFDNLWQNVANFHWVPRLK